MARSKKPSPLTKLSEKQVEQLREIDERLHRVVQERRAEHAAPRGSRRAILRLDYVSLRDRPLRQSKLHPLPPRSVLVCLLERGRTHALTLRWPSPARKSA